MGHAAWGAASTPGKGRRGLGGAVRAWGGAAAVVVVMVVLGGGPGGDDVCAVVRARASFPAEVELEKLNLSLGLGRPEPERPPLP